MPIPWLEPPERRLQIFILSFLFALPASARTWPVSDAASLSAAIEGSAVGDTIELAGGGQPYRASIPLKKDQSLIGRNAPMLIAGAEPAIVVTAGNVTVEGVTVDVAGNGDGVAIRDHAGTFTFRGGRIGGSGSGAAVRIEGGEGDVTFDGAPIERTGGGAVIIRRRNSGVIAFRGGSTIRVSGAKSDAISIEDTAAAVTFADALDIAASGARAFYAKGVNRLAVSGTPATLTSTDAAALEIRSTALDAAFTAVSAARSAKGFLGIGIILQRATGRLAVAGGTIRGAKARGIEVTHSTGVSLKNMVLTSNAETNGVVEGRCAEADNLRCNAALVLQDVDGFTAEDVRIDGSGQYGISGNGVRGATFRRIEIARAGNEVDEHAMHFQNVSGDVRFIECTIRAAASRGLFLENRSGQASVAIEKCSFAESAAPNGGQAMLVQAAGDAKLTLAVTDSQFSNIWTGAIQAMAGDQATLDVTISGSRFDHTGGVAILGEQGASVTAAMRANRLSESTAPAITAALGGTSAGAMTATLDGNTVNGARCGGCDGIDVENRGRGTMHASIVRNDIAHVDGAAIRVQAGARPADAANLCVRIEQNRISDAADARGAIRLINRTASRLRLAGYAGKANDAAAATAHVRARNQQATAHVQLAPAPGENAITGCEDMP